MVIAIRLLIPFQMPAIVMCIRDRLLALGAMPQTCDLEQAAQLPEYLKEPVDFWCETGALSASVQEQTLLVSGKLRYCMLGTDACLLYTSIKTLIR